MHWNSYTFASEHLAQQVGRNICELVKPHLIRESTDMAKASFLEVITWVTVVFSICVPSQCTASEERYYTSGPVRCKAAQNANVVMANLCVAIHL